MKKVFIVQKYAQNSTNYDAAPFYKTKEEAIDAAKRLVGPDLKQGYAYDYAIMEVVAGVRQPVPAAEVVEITGK